MMIFSFIVGALIGVVVMRLVQVGRQADLDDALMALFMKWDTRALRAGEESLLIQEFLLDLESLRGDRDAE